MNEPSNEQFRAAASQIVLSLARVYVDERAQVQRAADGGAYVEAWIWVGPADIATDGKSLSG